MKTFIFVCFLSIAAVQDVSTFRISNRVLKCMLLAGFLCNACCLSSIVELIKVCGCSFLIGLLFYRMRVLGAGDVKLMTICGLYVSFPSMLIMWYVALLVTSVGGLVLLISSGQFKKCICAACSYLYKVMEHKKVVPYTQGVGTDSGNVFPFGFSVLLSVLWLLLVKGAV